MNNRSSNLDFKLLFESAPGLFLVLQPDAEFKIVGASDAYLHATLTERQKIIGRGLFEVFPDNPDDPHATGTSNLRASLERVVANKAPDTMAVQKYDIRRPESQGGGFEERFWSPLNSPVLSAEGQIRYIIHRVEDVTEFVRLSRTHQLERERSEALERQGHAMEAEILRRSQELDAANKKLRQANQQLTEVDKAKTAFFSNISHEFRTPLTLLLGPVEDGLSDTEEPLAQKQRERLELVRYNALRLLKLVNTLLDFSRIEAGRIRATYAPTDIAHLTKELVSAFQSAVDKAGLRLVVDCPPLSEPAYVDHEMWEKIVLNLVSNAFKFTFEGEIAVGLHATDGHYTLSVRDTGTGIPEEQLPQIFERFHRVQGAKSRTHEGTGIGLSLVQELVKRHGGAVSVESIVNKGTTFTVSIPKGKAHLPAEAIVSSDVSMSGMKGTEIFSEETLRWLPHGERSPETEPSRSGNGRLENVHEESLHERILIADDNPDLRAYMSRLLEPHYRVEAVGDGQAALELTRKRIPDLVLSDVMMPRLDGFGLLRELRADERTRTIPVVLLSARAGEESAVEGLNAGADDYLVKPFSARELLARVRTHLELARVRRALLETEQGRLEAVLQQMPAGVIIAKASSGELILANGKVDAILHHSFRPGEGIEQYSSYQGFHLDGRAYKPEEYPLSRSLLTGEEIANEEIEYLCGDGIRRILNANSAPIRDRNGNIVAGLVIFYDVTEHRRLEQQLLQSQRMEAVGRLAGGVAHDFNNFLTVIIGHSQLLIDRLASNDPMRTDIQEVEKCAQHAADLTRQLLAFSRKQILQPKVLDLNAIVANLEKMLRRLIGEDVELTVRLNPSLGRVKTDPGQVEQIIVNLAANARDAMPGGGKLTIETANTDLGDLYARQHADVAPGQYVMLAVSDTGAGMDRETQARIFEPFFTTKERGKGTGLGLATVYGIVKQSQGHIWVYSEPGHGSTFKVYLPRIEEAADITSPLSMPSPSVGGSETVLLVEDDDTVRRLVRQVLSCHGYTVMECRSPEEALAMSSNYSGRIHLMVTDVVMPGSSGPELAQRITAQRPETRVLFMSGYTDDAIVHHGVLDAGVAFLEKPFTPDNLLRKVREVLGTSQ